MLDRLRSIGLGSGRLIRAEGRGLLERARRGVGWSGLLAAGGVVALAGLAAIATAATAALAATVGWIAAVGLAGAVALLVGLAWVAIAWWRLEHAVHRSAIPLPVRAEAAAARREVRGDLPSADGRHGAAAGDPPSSQSDGARPHAPRADWGDRAARLVARNPGAVAGGVICVVGLLGPKRSLRLASTAVRAGRLAVAVRNGLDGGGSRPANGEAAAVGLGRGGPAPAAPNGAGRASATPPATHASPANEPVSHHST